MLLFQDKLQLQSQALSAQTTICRRHFRKHPRIVERSSAWLLQQYIAWYGRSTR